MVTSNKKITPASAVSTTPAKKPVAKKVVAATPASKAAPKKTAATPVKKTSAPSTVKAAPTPSKRVSTPKLEESSSKPVASAKKASRTNAKKNHVTPEDRYHMIATAAYFRAEQRGFAGGYEMEDWISGEAQIDTMLNA